MQKALKLSLSENIQALLSPSKSTAGKEALGHRVAVLLVTMPKALKAADPVAFNKLVPQLKEPILMQIEDVPKAQFDPPTSGPSFEHKPSLGLEIARSSSLARSSSSIRSCRSRCRRTTLACSTRPTISSMRRCVRAST